MNKKIIFAPRLAVNFVVLSGAEFLSKVFAAVAFAYLARVLGPIGYGHLEFVLAIIFFFTLLVDSGLSAFGAREIAKDVGVIPRLTAHILFTRFLLAVVSFLILTIVVLVIDKPWPVKRLILLYSLTLFALPGLLQWIFQGLDMMQYVALASIIRWSIFGTGIFLFVRGQSQLWIIPLIEGLAIVCIVAFYVGVLFHKFGVPRYRIDYGFMLSIYRRALPIGASEMVWALKVYFATIALGIIVGGSEVGWFGAAHRLVIALHTFVWLYFFNLLPSIARTTQSSLDVLHRLMRTSIQVTVWPAVFLGVTGTIFAEPIITLLYGAEYQEATPAFQVLIWVIPFALMSGHYRYVLIGYDRQQLEFLSGAYGAGLTVLLNLILIPIYGLIGAAWAFLISEALIWGLAYYFTRRMIAHISMLSHLYRPLIAGAVLTVTLYLLPPTSFWLGGAVAVLVYGLSLSIMQPNLLLDIRSMLVPYR